MKRLSAYRSIPFVWLLFFVLSAAIYYPAINGGFIWDDIQVILNNPIFREPNTLFKIWFGKDSIDYWPVSYTLYWLEWLCFGSNPIGYHVVNLVIHAFCGALLWRILVVLNFSFPLFAAFLFCIHPLNVDAVAWIVQEKTTLGTALILVSTLFYLDADKKKYRYSYGLSLFFFILANLTKISGVTWPFVFLIYEWYRSNYKIKETNIKRVAPFFAISLLLGLLNVFWYASPATTATIDVIRDDGFISRLAGAGQNLAFYIYKILLPLNLNFVYPRWSISPENILSWIPTTIVLGLLFLAFATKRMRTNGVLLFILYVCITLFPVIGFFEIHFMKFSWVADHYMYLTLPGVIAATVAIVSTRIKIPALKVTAAVALSGFYIYQTATRSAVYTSDEQIWTDTIAKNPQAWGAHLFLGSYAHDRRQLEKAIYHYSEAIKIRPDDPEMHYNLAIDLMTIGKNDESIAHYQEALKLRPNYSDAHDNLAVVLVSEGKIDEGISHYRAAIEINPNDSAAHNNMGVALSSQNKLDQAISEYNEALRITPVYPEAHNNLALALGAIGKTEDAIAHFHQAIAMKPDYVQAHNNLAQLYLKMGNKDAAARESEIVEQISRKISNF